MDAPLIEARALTKDFGLFRAVDRVSFVVKPGEVLGFLGPNGAGKTTTMRMLAGFLPPTSGQARLGGYDVATAPVLAKRQLGYLPENGPLYPEMTVHEFLSFAASIREMDTGEARRALRRVEVDCELEDVRFQTIETLSKGYRQRVGLAQAMLHDPPCLIMDEPTDGLDPNQKREMRRLIAGMAREKAIVLSTHILEEVQAMCTRVILIAEGSLVLDATLEGLLERHPDRHAVVLEVDEAMGAGVAEQLQQTRGLGTIEKLGTARWLVRTQGGFAPALEVLWERARACGWAVRRLEAAPVSLDDVFARLTQTQERPQRSAPRTSQKGGRA